MNDEKDSLRIRYEYEQHPEAKVHYAHGVWGGINPQGEVELDFYTESDKLPPYSERILAADGSFGHEITPQDDNLRVVVRQIHSKVLLNYHTARAVLEWLQEKVDAIENEIDDPLFVDGESGIQH